MTDEQVSEEIQAPVHGEEAEASSGNGGVPSISNAGQAPGSLDESAPTEAQEDAREPESEGEVPRIPVKEARQPRATAEDAGAGTEGVEGTVATAEAPKAPAVPIPAQLDLNQFQKRSLTSLHQTAQEIGLRVAGVRSKHQLIFEILQWYGRRGTEIIAEGLLEYSGEAYGFLRWPDLSFAPNADDVYITGNLIKRHGLRAGNLVKAVVRAPREREKFLSVDRLLTIEGVPAEEWQQPRDFEQLTALHPTERLIMEHPDLAAPSARVVDLVAPLGKGQRGLIVAPPRGGKTILLKNIAVSIQKNHPEVELIVMLLDERPEEVTDFRETVDVPIFASTFDESPKRHVQVADMVWNRAKRLVEAKRDVVILLDSLTRLARGHNAALQGKGSRLGSGGLDNRALQKPRKFFGAARNVEEGGSLTILATCLIETESRMDDVIFEEFKGTGNMEITLDRELAEKRVFPAIHLLKSGTRRDELLYHPDEFRRISALRKQLTQLPAGEAMEVLVKNIKATRTNAELLLKGIR